MTHTSSINVKFNSKNGPNAKQVKVRVVEHILATYSSDIVIASELQYADFKRRVDLLVISDTILAIEIKSARDNVNKLATQILDYNNFFNATAVVCDKQLTSRVNAIVQKSVGIYEIDDSLSININRKEQYHRVAPRFLITFLVLREIRGLASTIGVVWSYNDSIDALRRRIIEVVDENTLQQFVVSKLKERYKSRFENFNNHRTSRIIDDDIFYLTVSPQEKYRFK